MSKENNLTDYLTDLYQGIKSKKPDASRNPQDFRGEIEQIETKSPEWDGSYETSPDMDFTDSPVIREAPDPITANGDYTAADLVAGADGISRFTVAVPMPEAPEVEEPNLIHKTVTGNGFYAASDDGADGYLDVSVEVPMPVIVDASDVPITENGTYEAKDYGVDGISKIVVDVPSTCDRPLGYWFFTEFDQREDMDWDEEGNEIYTRSGIKESVTVPPQVQDGSATSFLNLFQSVSEFPYDYSALVNTTGLWVKKIEGVINCANVTALNALFYNCSETEEICPIINTENVTDFNHMFTSCPKLKNIPPIDIRSAENVTNMISNDYEDLQSLYLKNIRISITIGNSYMSPSLPLESLVGLCYELVDTGSTKTLTIGTRSDNLEKLAGVYVKLVEVTDEMIAEDKFVAEKKPFVVCESTDEGAVLITDYVTRKNWSLK